MAVLRSASPNRIAYEVLLALGCAVATVLANPILLPHPVALSAIAATVTAAIVPLRRRHPVQSLITAAVIGIFVGGMSPLVLFLLSVALGSQQTPWRPASLAFAATLGSWIVGTAFAATTLSTSLHFAYAMDLLAILAFTGVLPAVVAWTFAQRRSLIIAMRESNSRLHRERDTAASQAQIRERSRIARDLHDSLGHKLTLISLYTATLDSQSDANRARTIALLRDTSASAMTQLRHILDVLPISEQDDEGAAPLRIRIDGLIESVRSAGPSVVITRSNQEWPLPSIIERAAYRTIQEGITNALKHAPGATVYISVQYEPDALHAEVVNNLTAAALPMSSSRRGLAGLTERISLAGGILNYGMTDTNSFRLTAFLPYDVPAMEIGGMDMTRYIEESNRRFRWGTLASCLVLIAATALYWMFAYYASKH
ncbi:sensor histidine kinase [Actinoplanes sp. TFC3]|uniref:sensor histidine kinase n=1 Tax=Actinoplanes sp. TFC3 TaxID=1710355 RepID=UPI0012906F66|nr:histidine kinase [Actinoplanes sp. TFC3]